MRRASTNPAGVIPTTYLSCVDPVSEVICHRTPLSPSTGCPSGARIKLTSVTRSPGQSGFTTSILRPGPRWTPTASMPGNSSHAAGNKDQGRKKDPDVPPQHGVHPYLKALLTRAPF